MNTTEQRLYDQFIAEEAGYYIDLGNGLISLSEYSRELKQLLNNLDKDLEELRQKEKT